MSARASARPTGRPRRGSFPDDDRTLPPMPARTDLVQARAVVSAVREMAPGLRRITLTAPEFEAFATVAPDEYVALVIPPPGAPLVMPELGLHNVRAAVAAIPEQARPSLRWYTVAARHSAASIDLDVVTHGGTGPGSRWASAARVGDVIGLRSAGACYQAPAGVRQLLVADETAVPALRAVLDAAAPSTRALMDVHVELEDTRHAPGVSGHTIHRRGENSPGSVVLAYLERALTPARVRELGYAWVCGETGLATGVRRLLVARGMDRRAVFFSGYWKVGAVRT